MTFYLSVAEAKPTGEEAGEFLDIPSMAEQRPRHESTREYEGDGIQVHWDSRRCIHSQLCVLGAPSVFDYDARPWVHAAGTAADEVARVIDTCPSGALSYTRTDGRPNGRRGRTAGEGPEAATRADGVELSGDADPVVGLDHAALPVITPLPDGPLDVRGPVVVVDADGGETVVERVVLCRCGQSASKPRCDGTHARAGFTAAGAVPPASSEQLLTIRRPHVVQG